MNVDFLNFEEELKENSLNSTDNLIKYILFELMNPIEDYFLAINLLKENYPKNEDIRIAILGAYLSSTWLSFEENVFIKFLQEHVTEADNQNKAIIYYLYAYDIYMKCDTEYPIEYLNYLRKSISYSNRFVYNYVRLSEITDKNESRKLLNQAISNIETVWTEDALKKRNMDSYLNYDSYINEFILGVDINIFEYKALLYKRDLFNARIRRRFRKKENTEDASFC